MGNTGMLNRSTSRSTVSVYFVAALAPEKSTCTHWIRFWIILKDGVDVLANIKICPAGKRSLVVQPIAWTLYWLNER
jgi:hypothetical protein